MNKDDTQKHAEKEVYMAFQQKKEIQLFSR